MAHHLGDHRHRCPSTARFHSCTTSGRLWCAPQRGKLLGLKTSHTPKLWVPSTCPFQSRTGQVQCYSIGRRRRLCSAAHSRKNSWLTTCSQLGRSAFRLWCFTPCRLSQLLLAHIPLTLSPILAYACRCRFTTRRP